VPWGGASSLAPTTVGVAILAACVLAALGRVLPRPAVDGFATATAAGIVVLDVLLLRATRDGRVVTWVGGWVPDGRTSVGIVLVADSLGAGLALLAAVLVLAALVYSWQYYEDVHAHYHVLLLLFLAGMTGFALSGDVFDMFVFFELMGAVAYALTGFKVEDPSSLHGGLSFAIVNSLGAYVTLTGIAILYARTGALGFPQLSTALAGHPPDALVVAAFCLVSTGFLVKAAAVPFHFWTADAEAVAPTPVCVLFSCVMVELGVYGVGRLWWTTFSATLPYGAVRRALLVLGVLTGIVGAVMCFLQRHLKRLLAYSTIAHVGLFLAAAGVLDPPGTTGAAVYVLGHAGMKGALFLLAGVVLNRYGGVDELTLHGRGRDARVLPWLFLAAGLALAGLPPFGTGLGKAIGEEALAASGYWFGPVLFVVVSAVTGAAVLRAGARIYRGLGPVPRDDSADETTGDQEQPETGALLRTRWTMAAPIVALLAGGLAVGAVPAVARDVSAAAVSFLDRNGYVAQALQGTPAGPRTPLPEAGWTASGSRWASCRRCLPSGWPRPRCGRHGCRGPSARPPAVPPRCSPACAGCTRATSGTTSPGSSSASQPSPHWWACRCCRSPSRGR
jgi:multicomponent Na+:H+ antiporter subunit D